MNLRTFITFLALALLVGASPVLTGCAGRKCKKPGCAPGGGGGGGGGPRGAGPRDSHGGDQANNRPEAPEVAAPADGAQSSEANQGPAAVNPNGNQPPVDPIVDPNPNAPPTTAAAPGIVQSESQDPLKGCQTPGSPLANWVSKATPIMVTELFSKANDEEKYDASSVVLNDEFANLVAGSGAGIIDEPTLRTRFTAIRQRAISQILRCVVASRDFKTDANKKESLELLNALLVSQDLKGDPILDPNIRDTHGFTALEIAIAKGNLELVNSLLGKDSKHPRISVLPDLKISNEMTPLNYAIALLFKEKPISKEKLQIVESILAQQISFEEGKTKVVPLSTDLAKSNLDVNGVLSTPLSTFISELGKQKNLSDEMKQAIGDVIHQMISLSEGQVTFKNTNSTEIDTLLTSIFAKPTPPRPLVNHTNWIIPKDPADYDRPKVVAKTEAPKTTTP